MNTVTVEKTCVRCGYVGDDFSPSNQTPDGLYPYCRSCNRERSLANHNARKGDPEYRAHRRTINQVARHIRVYGISPEDYADLLSAQDGVCAICRKPETVRNQDGPRPLCLDHDHLTGTVRGLLCHSCNLSLGHFDDDPDRLEAAARYLRG